MEDRGEKGLSKAEKVEAKMIDHRYDISNQSICGKNKLER